MTKHYDQHLMMCQQTAWGRLAHGIGTASDKWFLVNTANEVARIPFWLFCFITDRHAETGHFGPYVFYNNFENTTEAAYLRQMFQYPQLTPTAAKKVQAILDTYGPCISMDKEFVKALETRETELKSKVAVEEDDDKEVNK